MTSLLNPYFCNYKKYLMGILNGNLISIFYVFIDNNSLFLKKVLIIEISGEISDKIEKILTPPDYKLFFSHNRVDGYKIALRYLPDLILFCMNKDNDDLNFIDKICSNEELSAIPLIVTSETFSFEEQRAVMQLGADDYIPNIFLKDSLLNTIEKRFLKLSFLKNNVHSSITTFDENNGSIKKNDHVLVKIGNKIKLVEFSEIICITALKEYSKIIISDKYRIIVRKSLKKWLSALPSETFLRIHRATIININYIENITKVNERTYTVHLKNIKETFDFSHRYANIMRHTFLK